jgi:predicted flap endonuclease-1-like 5' DNA nuclease
MNKWRFLLLSVVILLSISACGNKEGAPISATNAPVATVIIGGAALAKSTDIKVVNTNGLPSAMELIEHTSKATQGLKSFTMDTSINQDITMNSGETKQSQKMKMNTKSDIIKEPMQVYQEITTTISGVGQMMKQYLSEAGVFTQIGGVWTKMPDAQKDQLISVALVQAKPEKQLELFEKITKDTKISEEGTNYVMIADVSGDSIKELAQSLLPNSGDASVDMTKLLEQMNISSLKMKYLISKKDYLPVQVSVDMVMSLEQEGQQMAMNMKTESRFSNLNKVGEISIPQEAMDAVK